MRNLIACVLTAGLFAGATVAHAQGSDSDAETIETLASSEEAERVRETLAEIDCEATEIEKESDALYEIDDARCGIGQYDIKVNGDYRIWVMTLDE